MLPEIKPEERAYVESIFGKQTENFLKQTRTFLTFLLEENEKHNLIGENTVATLWQRHILDSLQLTNYLTKSTSEVVVDLGSGGGFPSIPLAIAMKTLGIKKYFILVEKSPVKATFLRNMLAKLQLDGEIFNDVINKTNFQILAGEKKTMITSRAFKSVTEILAITPDFVEEIVLLKGEKWVEEIEEAQNKNLLVDWQFETMVSITGVGTVLWMYK
ncbi:MAG: 16S rRNA (guanine(527)-N(7))-methyltransferase RsmG [Rickettsiales bacterium]|nr:16S rRNA (guanine(527)-N(7))-methyltransferase RsmG [Rickettsiales bacterium]